MEDMEDALSALLRPPKPRLTKGLLPPVVKFRSWIGGDRDGNPFVTPEITQEAYALQANVALTRHLADLDLLVQELSQWGGRTELSDELAQNLENMDPERPGNAPPLSPGNRTAVNSRRCIIRLSQTLAKLHADPAGSDLPARSRRGATRTASP